ncbi:transcriptional regulator [Actinomycetospora sp. NBRC 106375]|uniref:TetR/AcrR family transcriptional regulator n=1 Tax=Actinomycetospora sp. NBRC 106375 TaxID=3032207 RepID=UPI0024A280F9|nr:TetR/AcrR family transcriptional regulator [Actinomycetospora sp. NBRC 106375]GLZ48909.1 transcriptional regulator [Actinomycetospora sp. NBRC 106375]
MRETAPPRRLTAKGRATRARIVAAAAELVFAHGVARTGIDDVRREAGVSASQLYHYFADKDELMRAVIAHQTDGILEVQRPLLDHLDSFAALEQWRDMLVALQEERHCTGGCPIGSIAAELADEDPEARADLVAGFERWEAPIREGLARMRERGDLRADADTDALALALLAALQGGLLLTQTRRVTAPLRIALDTVLAQIRTQAA